MPVTRPTTRLKRPALRSGRAIVSLKKNRVGNRISLETIEKVWLIQKLRRQRKTWAEIGKVLGVTRQRAEQISHYIRHCHMPGCEAGVVTPREWVDHMKNAHGVELEVPKVLEDWWSKRRSTS
jgi:hypothetical protein